MLPKETPGESTPQDRQDVIPGQEDLSAYLDDGAESEETPGTETSLVTPTPAAAAAAPVESVEDRLNKAIATIEALNHEVRSLREAPSRSMERETPGAQPELETILGVPLPKDRSRRAVKLTAQDLINLKWNEDPVHAIETLGNVLVNYVLGVVPALVQEGVAAHTQNIESKRTRASRFNEMFPDLVEFADLGEIVERRLRAEGVHERYRGEDYLKQIGTEVRKRVAGMRGQTLEDYEGALPQRGTQLPAQRTPTSRTTTGAPRTMTSPQGTRGAKPSVDAQQREMQDLF